MQDAYQPSDSFDIQIINPLVAQLTHRPFPEVADVLRSVADQITLAWDAAVREAMPQMRHLTFNELKDSTPQILLAIADALGSDDPDLIRELMHRAPSQGLSRLELNFDVIEVMQEDRLLRALIVQHVEAGLDRRMDPQESAALHAAVDVMLQRSVIALVDKQKLQLRAAAETELKFLSFLSHDMNNNLNAVVLWMQVLEMRFHLTGGFEPAENALRQAQSVIQSTMAGMRRMLDHERLRKNTDPTEHKPVNLRALARRISLPFNDQSSANDVTCVVDISSTIVIESDEDLLSLVIQNLVGNGVKFSTGGTVRVGCDPDGDGGRVVISVSDEGPGISPEMVQRIFMAFKRGEVHGQEGVGLGLAIASHAANLLDGALTVESTLGIGSTFRLSLPGNLLRSTEA